MRGIATRLVYVESAGDEESVESFAWYDGNVLTADQHAEREQVHREMTDIVKQARFDEKAEWGRAVRCGDRLLVEVEVERAPAPATRRRIATVVVSVARPDSEWADEAAGEIAAILRDGGIGIAADRLARAFAEGWSRKPRFTPLRVARFFAAAGAALAVAWWWIRTAGRLRQRAQGKALRPGERR